MHPPVPAEPGRVWAASGAMGLTGRRGGPPLPVPVTLPEGLLALQERLAPWVRVDVPALLGERAALAGLTAGGDVSCGGATRLLPAADAWIAVSLARDDDRAAVPAWLGLDHDPEDLGAAVRRVPAAALVAAAAELGMPVAALGEVPAPATAADVVPARRLGEATPCPDPTGLLVVDLSSLWAGPLCADLLGRAGARVVKVESTRRPDGARSGPPAFYDLLHAGHEAVAVDFASAAGREALARLVARADVVVEGSRPRALAQLGITPEGCGARVWVSVTAYGREGPGAARVGFGDDAAVAGGLVAWDGHRPCFCADAVADPLAGVTAAVTVLEALAGRGRWLVDVALARVAAWMGRGPAVAGEGPVAPPRARPARGQAPALGAHTATVLAEAAGP